MSSNQSGTQYTTIAVSLALAKTIAFITRTGIKEIPPLGGHHIQVDVKFISLKDPQGNMVRRYQYTAIDDATRVKALKIYVSHNQNSIGMWK